MDRGKGSLGNCFVGGGGFVRCCPLLLEFIFSEAFSRYYFRLFYQNTGV